MKGKWISVVLALALAVVAFGALPAPQALAGTCTSQANGNWSAAGTWGAGCTGAGGIPGTGDSVNVAHTVTLTANVNIGSGTVTVQNGGVLNLVTFLPTAATLTINDGGEVQQGGTGTAPAGTITTRSYAPNSTYTFNGTQAGLTGTTHPTYGNLNFAPTPSGNGTFALNLDVKGNLIINFGNTSEIRFATTTASRTHSISGNLKVMAGTVVGNNGTTAVSMITIGGNLEITGGTFRGTNDSGNVTYNIAGNISNNGGTWQQDDGSSTGTFTVVLNGSSTQSVGGSSAISFENLTVNNSAVMDEVNDVTVTGTLINNGTIRNSNTVAGNGAQSFGLTGVAMNVTAGTGTITVDRKDVDHPNATTDGGTKGTKTGKYWKITGTGFTADLTLPHAGLAAPNVCKYPGGLGGAGWDCQVSASTGTTATRNGVTSFSDWAVGSSVGPTAVTLRTLTAAAPLTPWAAAPAIGLALAGGLAAWRRRA